MLFIRNIRRKNHISAASTCDFLNQRDSDYHQNLMVSSLANVSPFRRILWINRLSSFA